MNDPPPYRNGRRFGTVLGWDPMRLVDDLMTWQPPGSELVWSAHPSSLDVTLPTTERPSPSTCRASIRRIRNRRQP